MNSCSSAQWYLDFKSPKDVPGNYLNDAAANELPQIFLT